MILSRRRLVVLPVLALALVLAACVKTDLKPVNMDKFRSVCRRYQLEVGEAAPVGASEQSLCGYKEGWSAVFCLYADQNTAIAAFEEQLAAADGGSYYYYGGNYGCYTRKDTEPFIYYEYVADTAIFIEGGQENKAEIYKFLVSLGY